MKKFGSLLFLVLFILWGRCEPARALEFECIELSRYKNLMRIFFDDPANFTFFFSLPKNVRPPSGACRGLLVTGSLSEGDTHKLLEKILENKGWLSSLYLYTSGENPEEELKLSLAIRKFWLKTTFIGFRSSFYEPDFAPRQFNIEPSATNAWVAVPLPSSTSLRTSIQDYQRSKNNVPLKIGPSQLACRDSCVTLFKSGIYFHGAWQNTYIVEPRARADGNPRLEARAILQTFMATNDMPKPGAELLTMTLSTRSGFTADIRKKLRDSCAADFDATQSVEDEIRESVDGLAKTSFNRFTNVKDMTPRFASLERVTTRLSHCLAGNYERERLVAFQRICGSVCSVEKLQAGVDEARSVYNEKLHIYVAMKATAAEKSSSEPVLVEPEKPKQ